MVASTYLLLSMPKATAESAEVGLINSWFLKLVARQELPLRQLALSSFAFDKARIKVLGTDEIDVRAILEAILQNHSDPRAQTHRGQYGPLCTTITVTGWCWLLQLSW